MNDFFELHTEGSFKLQMTTEKAGRVGPSYDIDNINRIKLLNDLNISPENVLFVHQQHSRKVIYASEHSRRPPAEADGIITGSRTDCIAVTVADCMPVYLYDRKNETRALLHSGWKGTGIALNALEMMRERFGTKPSDVTAVLGPAIGSCCYNVDDKRAAQFGAEWGADAVKTRDGINYLSLKDANTAMLSRAGVENIIAADLCTCCGSRFGSYRRQGPDEYTLMFVISSPV